MIRIAALVLLVQTLIWIVLTGISLRGIDASWTGREYVAWAAHPDIFYLGNYMNAALLTVTAVVLFSALYSHFSGMDKVLAVVAWSFVPVYGMLNLISYSLQLKEVPDLARQAAGNPGMEFLVAHLIQANSASLLAFINGLAYALLAIPSVLFGRMLIADSRKYSGAFLMLNGFSCIVGFAGYIAGSALVASGLALGGILFMISLGFMIREFDPAG